MNESLALSTFTMLYNHRHHLAPKLSHHPKENPVPTALNSV